MLKPYSLAQVQFVLDKEIGQEGKNSQVFRAHDPQLNAEIVIKKIEKARLSSAEEYFAESSLLYASAHTNVVPILYACQDDGHIFLATPYFSRGTLKALMAARALTVREIVTLGTHFLSGLHHIHSKGLIHFDVKPENILISDRGEAVLSDFGLAKQISFAGIAAQDRLYGKMSPPEAFDTDQFTARLDIYQAGLTLYRMCVGDVEFYRQYAEYLDAGVLDRHEFRHAVRNQQFPDTSIFPEHIPIGLQRTIRRCLKSDPNERLPSALAIVNEFSSLDGAILDWQYEPSVDERVWTKVTEERSYRLVVASSGASVATRKVGDGEVRRIREFCKDQLSAKEIRQFLGDHE